MVRCIFQYNNTQEDQPEIRNEFTLLVGEKLARVDRCTQLEDSTSYFQEENYLNSWKQDLTTFKLRFIYESTND